MRCTRYHERQAQRAGACRIAGVDEVGRGALFGPVVAAAVILPLERRVSGINDSKLLSAEVREALAQKLPFGDGTFDVVLSSLVVHHVPKNEQKTALGEMVRVLKPGGQLAMLELLGQAEAYRKVFKEAGMTDIQTAWSRPLIFVGFRSLRARKPAQPYGR